MERYGIAAVMPIKLENERLPGKNTMLLGGKPLLQYELESLLQIQEIEKIYVYCSQKGIVDYLPDGVCFLRRPEYLDLPQSNFTQIFDEFMHQVDADIYVYAHATAPFVKVETMRACIEAVLGEEYDSAFCATKIQDFLWKGNKPLNFKADNIPRSQDIEPIYRETSGVYVFKKEVFEKSYRRIGEKPFIKEVSYREAIDINVREDFELAEKLL
ncbi:MAG: acylneuraminate cytidylyltransferase [Lachnospiraceae bacterium]|nr:acylneuraminate cytidylyltransferase [Lachnospiraceae bacterium]